MSHILPWKAWYGPESLELDLPPDWKINTFNMSGGPRLSDLEIKQAIRKPFGTPGLSEIARGKKNAVIAVDDLSRPTEAGRIIPGIIDELASAGIEKDDILILIALGGHKAMNRLDLLHKFGKEIVEDLTIYNHSAFFNLVSYGFSSSGTPIQINRFYSERDLKIGVGSIVPHPTAGFGGGGKIVLPGVAGAETILKNHLPSAGEERGDLINIDGNVIRTDVEEVARKVGLHFIVNQVSNELGEAAGIFAGDFIEAHRAGIQFAHKVYATPKPKEPLDIAIINAFPKDTDIIQMINAFNIFRPGYENIIRPGGSLVIVNACTEGRGFHHLEEYKLPLWVNMENNSRIRKVMEQGNLIIFSPNLRKRDILDFYPEGTVLCNSTQELIKVLSKCHNKNTRVGIFPAGCLQILE